MLITNITVHTTVVVHLVCLFCIALNLACWTRTNDAHGYFGKPHDFSTVEECQAACIKMNTCVAIDWEPTNTGQTCWTLTLRFMRNTTTRGVIVHYELRRDCPS